MQRTTRWIMAIAIAAAAMLAILHRWGGLDRLEQVVTPLGRVGPRVLVIAVDLNVLAMLLSGVLWSRLLACLGHRLPARVGLAAYLSAGLAGYMVNVAGPILGSAVSLRRHGVCPGRAALLTMLANALGFCGVLVWAPVGVLVLAHSDVSRALPIVGRHSPFALGCLVAVIALATLALLWALATAPGTRNPLLRRLLGNTRSLHGSPLRLRHVLVLVPLSAAARLSGALSIYVVLSALSSSVAVHPLTVVGASALAGTLGSLAFFMPEGLGVREGALVTLLASTTGMPVAQGVVALLALRALDPAIKLGLLLALGSGAHTRRLLPRAIAFRPPSQAPVARTGRDTDHADVAA